MTVSLKGGGDWRPTWLLGTDGSSTVCKLKPLSEKTSDWFAVFVTDRVSIPLVASLFRLVFDLILTEVRKKNVNLVQVFYNLENNYICNRMTGKRAFQDSGENIQDASKRSLMADNSNSNNNTNGKPDERLHLFPVFPRLSSERRSSFTPQGRLGERFVLTLRGFQTLPAGTVAGSQLWKTRKRRHRTRQF